MARKLIVLRFVVSVCCSYKEMSLFSQMIASFRGMYVSMCLLLSHRILSQIAQCFSDEVLRNGITSERIVLLEKNMAFENNILCKRNDIRCLS